MSERLTETILTCLNVEVVCADTDLHIVPQALELVSPAGQALTDLFPELIGAEDDLVAVARGQSPRLELSLINRLDPADLDGRWPHYLSLTAVPHPELAGCLVLLVRDVTDEGRLGQQVMQQLNEMRLLRAQLEAANARLARLDADKSAFLRMAAHDLRSPLTVVRGYVEMVLKEAGPALGAEGRDSLEVVLTRSRQMARLIDDLLDVERIESGEVGLHKEPLDLGKLLAEVAEGFRPLAQEHGLALACQITAGLPTLQADGERLVQALNNLVSNSLKFTPAGGQVTLTARPEDAWVVVEVHDTGPGISEADQARLFQRFFRSDDARQRRIPGTGLGLSIVRAIIEQHGGCVFCRSQLGQGSTFGFSLPVDEG